MLDTIIYIYDYVMDRRMRIVLGRKVDVVLLLCACVKNEICGVEEANGSQGYHKVSFNAQCS